MLGDWSGFVLVLNPGVTDQEYDTYYAEFRFLEIIKEKRFRENCTMERGMEYGRWKKREILTEKPLSLEISTVMLSKNCKSYQQHPKSSHGRIEKRSNWRNECQLPYNDKNPPY